MRPRWLLTIGLGAAIGATVAYRIRANGSGARYCHAIRRATGAASTSTTAPNDAVKTADECPTCGSYQARSGATVADKPPHISSGHGHRHRVSA
jgi:hypothetical protein